MRQMHLPATIFLRSHLFTTSTIYMLWINVQKSECSAVAHKHMVVLSQGKQYYIEHYRHRLSVETLQLVNSHLFTGS